MVNSTLNRPKFGELVCVCSPYLQTTFYMKYKHKVKDFKFGTPWLCDLIPRNIGMHNLVSLTLRYFLSQASQKEKCPHLRVIEAMFGCYYLFGLEIFMFLLIDNPYS